MSDITINIDWPYFLGMIGSLIAIAYYANGRMTKLETSMEWLKEAFLELRDKTEELAESMNDNVRSRARTRKPQSK
jgi:hypothetical protein